MTQQILKPILYLLLSLVFIQAPATSFAQDAEAELQDSTELVDGETDDELESSSVWSLIGQAGPIRYPIFGILIAGIFLISLRSYELYKDDQMSDDLENTSFRHMSLNEISSKISTQPDFMLSRIMAKLVNVFETNRNADYLHDEISNYNSNQQDNFNTFRNRVDFLSDTAGALGLLGTVIGMFIVFSSGTLEKEGILMGMGLALMSTLLGLVVSIILNFLSTLTEGYFSKHLQKVTDKADELRFRLIELSENPTLSEKTFTNTNNNNHSSTINKNAKSEDNNQKIDEKENEPEKVNVPERILIKSKLENVEAGTTINKINIQLMGTLGNPIASEKLEVIIDGNGKINNKKGKDIVKTNSDGIANFSWTVDEKIGEKRILVLCADNSFKNIKSIIKTEVIAGKPESIKLLNNHQAGLSGKRLEKPISFIVTDSNENPVSNTKSLLKITMGNGKFNNGKREITATTNEEGKVFIDFTLGTEPGFNAIDISLPKFDITKSFQAVGQEVTV